MTSKMMNSRFFMSWVSTTRRAKALRFSLPPSAACLWKGRLSWAFSPDSSALSSGSDSVYNRRSGVSKGRTWRVAST